MARQKGTSSNSLDPSDLALDEALFDELITWNEVLSQTEFYQKQRKPLPKKRKANRGLELG